MIKKHQLAGRKLAGYTYCDESSLHVEIPLEMARGTKIKPISHTEAVNNIGNILNPPFLREL